jgi:hypothetical protein
MTTNEFVTLLQNELVLQRDPHTGERFAALLEEYYVAKSPLDVRPNVDDGVNIGRPQTSQEIAAQADALKIQNKYPLAGQERTPAPPSGEASKTAWTPAPPKA